MSDAARIRTLVRECPPLDVNSEYCYLLLCTHFSETCTVAENAGRLVAFQTGYLKPDDPSVLFIWQIAVGAEGRGRGIARGMIEHLLARLGQREISYLEQTVAKSNTASRALFGSVARHLRTRVTESPLFGENHFHASSHEAEHLLRIGPIPAPGGTTNADLQRARS